ncbi:hypothetical protein, partial [Streptomyces sp. NPDC048845]|uniref:hypothetical protein n=1 Tax=Streptomyces sp. NPDC048845 TaxID=3155390 RepID=UPI00342C675F
GGGYRPGDSEGGEQRGGLGFGTALTLNGTDAYAASDIPVVNTDRGFTVSAWVKLSERTPATGSTKPANWPGSTA